MKTIQISACPICKNTALQAQLKCQDYTVSQEVFQIVYCPNCETGITQNMPSLEAIGKYYQSENYISHSDTKKGFMNQLYHLVRQYMLRQKLQLVQKYSAKQNGKLADIGCGTGYFPNIMQTNGWQTYNADADENARKFGQEHFHLEVNTPPELFSKISDNELDVVTMWHVLEHVHDLENYLTQIYRMLASNGILVLALPNHTSYDAQYYGDSWAAWDVPRHLWHFSPKSIEVLAQRFNLRLIASKMMPFDSFYVALLSEQYRQNQWAWFSGLFRGKLSFLNGLRDAQRASSVIYVLKKF